MKKSRRADQPSSKSRPKGAQSIGSLVSQLISRRGYAQIAATDQFHEVISGAVGRDLAAEITVGKVNRGVLRVFASDSVTIQELTFQKTTILRHIKEQMPTASVHDIRFGVLTK